MDRIHANSYSEGNHSAIGQIERGLSGFGGFRLIDLDKNQRRFGKSAQSAFYFGQAV
jgi:hypothetical protein